MSFIHIRVIVSLHKLEKFLKYLKTRNYTNLGRCRYIDDQIFVSVCLIKCR